ncbi:unnamed protein product [Caenorhabditis bovis]|uniref:C2H2-type domain-containing protein n=1 Tax=Caenorhabditis bovis TaxID=2654633 RepID=A0A8S1FBC5_9PELO|nr:unnamed protein product [Caenorhabditis bovis]
MSDDEEEGRLRIAESPSNDQAPSIGNQSASSQPIDIKFPDFSATSGIKLDDQKEEGEIDDDDEQKAILPLLPPEPAKEQIFDMPNIPETATTKRDANGGDKRIFDIVDHKTPTASNRKRKEIDGHVEKRKSGVETIAATASTPTHRTKRTSHQIASAAISACFNDEEPISIPHVVKTPESVTTTAKKPKRDASTNVWQTKASDTSDMPEPSIMEAPPGSSMLIEVTVLYKTRDHLAVRVKGQELYGFFSIGLPPMFAAVAKKKQMLATNGEEKERSSSSNGRGTRANSQLREPNASKHEKRHKDSKKKATTSKDDDEEIDVLSEDWGSKEVELHEVDINTMHTCHYDGCEKRYSLSSELEYHITKVHQKKVVMLESICTQTDVRMVEKSTETDEAASAMPILKKESPTKSCFDKMGTPHYSDLSDDEPEKPDEKPPIVTPAISKPSEFPSQPPPQHLQQQQQPRSDLSASAALKGIAGGVASGTGGSVIGINPNVLNSTLDKKLPMHINTQAAQNLQKSPFIVHSPRTSVAQQAGTSGIAHGLSFLPANFMMPGMMMGMPDPRVVQQQHSNMARTPSRQDAHKIHELAKPKEMLMTPQPKPQQQQQTTPQQQQQQQQQQMNQNRQIGFMQNQMLQQTIAAQQHQQLLNSLTAQLQRPMQPQQQSQQPDIAALWNAAVYAQNQAAAAAAAAAASSSQPPTVYPPQSQHQPPK